MNDTVEIGTQETTDCRCPHRLVDWVHGTMGHPYLACPLYGRVTRYELPTSLAIDGVDGIRNNEANTYREDS